MPNNQQIDFILSDIKFTPTPEQEPIIHCQNREIQVAGGEQSGKSYLSAAFLITRMPFGKLFWLVAADYDRTSREFEYTCENLDKLGWDFEATKRIDPGEIDVVGGFKVITKSAKDPRKLAKEAPDGIIICEASQVDYETYLRCRGRIAPKRGWLFMSGTFEGSLGWYPEFFTRGQANLNEEESISFSLPTWNNLYLYPGGREDKEIKKLEAKMPKDWFMERFAGVPCPPKGRVFEEFSVKVHTNVGNEYEFDPSQPVLLWVDPGYASAYAVEVAQIRGEHVYIVDEIFESGFVTSDIIKIAKTRPWWNKVEGGAIDIAAKQHQAMPAPSEVWANESGVFLRSQKLEIRDGIERTKTFLLVNPATGQTRLHINARCKGLISELGGCPNPLNGQTAVYRWRTDREGNIVGDTPEDINNHAVKALAYGLVDSFGYSTMQRYETTRFF